jgi:FKBP-type peptidyl-prolyl cis-trans isomerase
VFGHAVADQSLARRGLGDGRDGRLRRAQGDRPGRPARIRSGEDSHEPRRGGPGPRRSIVANASPTPIGKPTATDDGLIYETLAEGTGPNAKSGDSVEVHYTGTLEDGTKFDSSVDRGKPFPVTLGMGSVIRGWDEGIPGMKVGEKRKLTIPAHLGYKEHGQGKIPPNAKLIFEVELMKINN